MIYEPQEDSYLLEKYVKQHAFGKVLDIGSGSGIQALAALPTAEQVTAVDIDDETLEHLKELENKHSRLRIIKSDLLKILMKHLTQLYLIHLIYLILMGKTKKQHVL